jgi:hypothetical protein
MRNNFKIFFALDKQKRNGQVHQLHEYVLAYFAAYGVNLGGRARIEEKILDMSSFVSKCALPRFSKDLLGILLFNISVLLGPYTERIDL